MKFVKVDMVPEVVRKRYARLQDDWKEFMAMNVKVVNVDLTQYNYKSVGVAYAVMRKSIIRSGEPIDICKRGDEIYLIRRDM